MSGAGLGIDLAEAIQSILGPENVRTGEEVGPYQLGGLVPQAAAFPGDEAEVSRVLALAWKEGLRVVPWGGGVHQAIGHASQGYDLALDLSRLNRVIEHQPGDMTATVQCGIRLTDLQTSLGASGQFFPLDPPLAGRATLGGILATNQSGPLRCRYGALRDLVLGVCVVHADGTISKGGAKVVKNATAYDITKLYVGSLGTLGVIVAASLRVYPRPPVEGSWVFAMADAEQGQALATRILASHCLPTRIEWRDRGDGQTSLLVSCAGVPEAVEAQAEEFRRMAGEMKVVPQPMADPHRAWEELSDFPWVPFRREEGAERAIWRAGVLPSACARGMRAIREAAGGWSAVSMAANMAAGIIRGEVVGSRAEELSLSLTAARGALTGLGGYLVILDAPAAVRAEVDVWGPPPDGQSLMRELKGAFDPRRVLNPGRFVGGI